MAVERLQTSRLILRKVEQRDTPLYYERIASREAVTKHMLWSTHKSVDETAAVVEKIVSRYENPAYHRWAIALREDDSIIGVAEMLRFEADMSACSFAYMIGEDYWGRGYATEALRAIFSYGFETLGLEAIEADHFTDNPASGRVMQKLGMEHCGSEQEKYKKDGVFHDAENYRISKERFFKDVKA